MDDISPNLKSFTRHLRAEDKGPATITAYAKAIVQLRDFLAVRAHAFVRIRPILGRRT